MTKPEQVFFAIESKVLEAVYDRSLLKLDAAVYVRFADDRNSAAFSSEPFTDSSEYRVHWIPDSGIVELVPQFELRPSFALRLEKEIGEFIGHEDIEATLEKLSGKM